jgi:hypothetical protein
VLLVVAPDSRFIGLAPVDRDLRWHAMPANRLGEKPLGGALVALFCSEEIDRLARLIHGAIQVPPLAFHVDVGLIHAPADPDGALAGGTRLQAVGYISGPSG